MHVRRAASGVNMSEKGPSERRRLDGPFSNVVSDPFFLTFLDLGGLMGLVK